MAKTPPSKNWNWPWKPPRINSSYLRCLAAIRAVLLGVPRPEVCRLYSRSDRQVRLWMEMFARGGIDALASKPRSGRPPKVKLQRLRDLPIPVLDAPSRAGELHWTGANVKSQIICGYGLLRAN